MCAGSSCVGVGVWGWYGWWAGGCGVGSGCLFSDRRAPVTYTPQIGVAIHVPSTFIMTDHILALAAC